MENELSKAIDAAIAACDDSGRQQAVAAVLHAVKGAMALQHELELLKHVTAFCWSEKIGLSALRQ